MAGDGQIVVLVTTESKESAREIARALLQGRKAACVSILPEVESHFWWQGALDHAREALLILKTRASLLEEVVAAVKAAHPYDVPEVIALPIVGGNPEYLRWLDAETEEA
jgi:periplasmic divalent cation tolerance protein